MRRPLALWSCLLFLAPAAPLLPLSGCGDGTPPNGASVSPVNPEEAAKQNKAIAEFYQGKKKSAGRRR
jgi:hypothetical protein